MDIDSLELKGNVDCFPNWHETQSKFSVDTEPNKPLEANCCTQEEDAWPSQARQSAREGIEETAATVAPETWATSGRWKIIHEKHMPNFGTDPKLLSHPWILHITPRIIKDNAKTQLS